MIIDFHLNFSTGLYVVAFVFAFNSYLKNRNNKKTKRIKKQKGKIGAKIEKRTSKSALE